MDKSKECPCSYGICDECKYQAKGFTFPTEDEANVIGLSNGHTTPINDDTETLHLL